MTRVAPLSLLAAAALALAGCSDAVCEDGSTQKCTSACGDGTEICVEGAWRNCDAPKPVLETCDGKDNDCDGTVDEDCDCRGGAKQACRTECGSGSEVCVNGRWENCDAPKPQQETCNGNDDNCNGQIDEVCSCVHGRRESCYQGAPGTLNVGQCRAGTHVCNAGTWGECEGQVTPAATDACTDMIDNDCDGLLNDGCTCNPGAQQDCGTDVGECVSGTRTCTANQWGQCLGETPPDAETDHGCDGKDNDCNGVTDDGLPADNAEPNDSCSRAQVTLLTLTDADAADSVTEFTVYPAGDVDYVKITTTEDAIDICCPGWPFCDTPDPECNTLSVELVQPVGPAEYEASVLVGSCTSPTQTVKTTSKKTLVWDGECGTDDGMDFWIRIAPTATSPLTHSCKKYKLKLRFSNSVGACAP